jgi:anti-anti-sigma factor
MELAKRALPGGMDDEGLFVTLFQGRLEPASGQLRYVDAGHGYCAIRRLRGELRSLTEHSLPLGVRDDEIFHEGRVLLGSGDALILYSDGLVEGPVRTVELAELAPALDGAQTADQMVGLLMEHTAERPLDDVTVMVVRRTGVAPAQAPAHRPEAAPTEAAPPAPVATDRAVVQIRGRFDSLTSLSVEDRFQAAVDAGATTLIVDLRAVTDIDSQGIWCLVHWLKVARRAGGGLHVVGPNVRVMAKLRTRALDRLIHIYDSVDAADADHPPAAGSSPG